MLTPSTHKNLTTMEHFSVNVNMLSSIGSEGPPTDLFVEESAMGTYFAVAPANFFCTSTVYTIIYRSLTIAINYTLPSFMLQYILTESQSEIEHGNDGEESFLMHRKLLRRRHVRKLQKTKERERRRKEEEEKQKELTRDRNRKRKAEKSWSLRQKGKASQTNSNAMGKTCSMGIRVMENSCASPVPVYGGFYITGTNSNNNSNNNSNSSSSSSNNNMSHYTQSPTSVLGLHRTIVSTQTKSSPQAIDNRTNAAMMVMSAGSGSMEINFRRHVSFSLPEFSPVRPTKFRKLGQ